MPDDIPKLIVWFQGLLTPTIALAVGFIAFWQAQINANRLRLELFDRRVRVYEGVRSLYSAIIRDTYCKDEDLKNFKLSTQDAQYLFGNEIRIYLDEWWKIATQLHTYRDALDQLKGDPDGASARQEYRKIMTRALDWTIKQGEQYPKKFEKYLRLKSGFFS